MRRANDVPATDRTKRIPREDIRLFALFWFAAMVLIISGLYAFSQDGIALGLAQMSMGFVVGPTGMFLTDLFTPRD